MTLAELIDLVCLKTHRNDPDSRAEARQYIRARYKMIWESRVWRDTIDMLTLDAENVGRITTMPGLIDRVISVRWGDSTLLNPEALGTTMMMDPARFDQIGSPASFAIITPVGVEKAPAGGKVTIRSSDANASYKVSIRGLVGNNERWETLTAAGTGAIESQYAYDQINSLSKDSSDYDLEARNADDQTILLLAAEETDRAFQRIHLQVQPTDAKALLVLFKRRFKPLTADSDATELTGIDNSLLAAAIADVLEGQRQYGKAQIKQQEASAMTQQMVDLENNQSANVVRLVPEGEGDGFVGNWGYDYGFLSK